MLSFTILCHRNLNKRKRHYLKQKSFSPKISIYFFNNCNPNLIQTQFLAYYKTNPNPVLSKTLIISIITKVNEKCKVHVNILWKTPTF